MAFAKLDIPGGIFADRSDYSAGPRWVAANKTRFQQGLPEKIGGWIAESGWTFTGVPNRVIDWITTRGETAIVVGTNKKLQLVLQDTLYDITPIASTANLSSPFATASGSPTVTVTDADHGASVGNYVFVSSASAIGGITPAGDYEVITVADANTYTITHGSNASSTVSSGGGSPTIAYLLSSSEADSVSGTGWGAGTWDTAREGGTAETKVITDITAANPGVVTTSTSHLWSTGDEVKLTGVAGMIEVNGVTYTITVTTGTKFSIVDTSAGFTAYTSVGVATKQFGWGYASSVATITNTAAQWSLDLWGEDLIATREGGLTYTWDSSVGGGTRAAVISNAPTTGRFSLVAVPTRHVVVYGAHDGAADDPLLVAWSDQEDFTTWTPTASNTAGSQHLDKGSKIMSATLTRDQIFILTDEAAFGQVFRGPPFTFGFRQLSTGCGPLSQKSVININGVIFWLGCGNFHMFDGSVKTLPSPLRDLVFDNLNESAQDTAFVGHNRKFTEIWFFYPSGTSATPDKYVSLNYVTNEWSSGTLPRTAWADEGAVTDYPIGLGSDGKLYYHENGNSDNGAAMTASIETGSFGIPAGEGTDHGADQSVALIDKVIPDVTLGSGSLTLTMLTKKYPGSPEVTKGPYTINSSTEKISLRAAGRQMRIKLESTGADDEWKWGTARMDVRRISAK